MANVAGSSIGALLLSNHVYLLNGLSILCYALTACIAATIPSECGRDARATEGSSPLLLASGDSDSPFSPPNRQAIASPADSKVYLFLRLPTRTFRLILHQRSFIRILLHSWQASYRSIFTLFSVPNPTFTVLIVFLINGLAITIETLLPQYTSLVLHWPLATVNRALALKALVSSMMLFALPSLRKWFLEPRMGTLQVDLLITQVSLLTNTIGVIGLAFSAPAASFILALCVYTSGIGLADSLTAYGTFTLSPGEKVSEFYMRTGLINTIAAMIGASLWSAAFSLVLRSGFLPLGVPFWMCAALFGAGVGGAMALGRRLVVGVEGSRCGGVVEDETG